MTFRDAIRTRDFVVTATLPLRPGWGREQVHAHVDALKQHVHAVQIGDDARAEGHMHVLAAASITLRRDMDAVVHLGCRDRNRVALEGALRGAAGLGITSLLLSRGQKLPDALRGKVKGVFDTEPPQLFELARRLGAEIDDLEGHGFFFGTPVSVMKPSEDWQALKVRERIDAGAGFLQTRPCLNMNMLHAYMRGIVSLKLSHRTSFVVEIPILGSADAALETRNAHPGARIPDEVVRRLSSGPDPVDVGIEIASDMLSNVAAMPGVSGANLVYEDDPGLVASVIESAAVET